MNNIQISQKLNESYQKNMNEEGGFLPKIVPLDCLPNPFDVYVDALDIIKYHYTHNTNGARQWLNEKFSNFNSSVLTHIDYLNENQIDKLTSVLAILVHLYRWDKVPVTESIQAEKSIDLPDGLRIPFKVLTQKLQQPACGTHWNTTLYNWQLKNKGGGLTYLNQDLSMKNLKAAHLWLQGRLGEQLEKWILVFVVIEARGTPAIRSIVNLIDCAARNDLNSFIVHIENLSACIDEIIDVFKREVKSSQIDHKLWREVIQPTFVWGLDDAETGVRLEGSSGLQVGVIQCLDNALGVESNSEMAKAAFASRAYMPIRHRCFLADLDEARFIIRQYILEQNNLLATHKYNECLKKISVFRSMHKGQGSKYIRGDGSSKLITTTGLAIDRNAAPGQSFRGLMQERLEETTDSIISEDRLK